MLLRTMCCWLALSSLALAQQAPIRPIRPASHVAALSPSQGPIAGGTIVTVAGSALSGVTVRIDGKVVTPLSQTDSIIELRMAAHDNGYVVIALVAADGTASYSRYLYVPPGLNDIPPGYITTVAGASAPGPFRAA